MVLPQIAMLEIGERRAGDGRAEVMIKPGLAGTNDKRTTRNIIAFIVAVQRTFPEALRHSRMCMGEWGALGRSSL